MTTNNPDAPPRITAEMLLEQLRFIPDSDIPQCCERHVLEVLQTAIINARADGRASSAPAGQGEANIRAIVDAVFRSVSKDDEGDIWLDVPRATLRVKKILDGQLPPFDSKAFADYELGIAKEICAATAPSPTPDAPHSLADCIARVANVENLERKAYGAPDKGEAARRAAEKIFVDVFESRSEFGMPKEPVRAMLKEEAAAIIEAELA